MTTYVKPAVRSAWAQNAGNVDLVDPGDIYAATGWPIGTKPPRQYMNWLENFTFNGIRYICQNGIVDYDAAETYQVGAVVMGPDFLVYQCIQAASPGHTPSAAPTFWGPLQTKTAAALDATTNAATTAFVDTYFVKKTASVGSLPGTVTNAQVPVGAVTQWQGSLALTFPQIGGSIQTVQVGQTAVTQWQSALSIAWSQLTGTKNADQLQGLVVGPNGAFSVNTIPRYDVNGYLYAAYFNQSSANNELASIGQVMCTNGADNFLRKASLLQLAAAIGAALGGINATNGWFRVPGGWIVQWLTCNPAGGTVSAVWPTRFPSTAFAAVATGTTAPTTCNVTGLSTTNVNVANSGGGAYVIGIGF